MSTKTVSIKTFTFSVVQHCPSNFLLSLNDSPKILFIKLICQRLVILVVICRVDV